METKTVQYRIYNAHSGADLGTYEASSEDAALDLMARDAGYKSFADSCEALGQDEDYDNGVRVELAAEAL